MTARTRAEWTSRLWRKTALVAIAIFVFLYAESQSDWGLMVEALMFLWFAHRINVKIHMTPNELDEVAGRPVARGA